jgi:hypothetical protein
MIAKKHFIEDGRLILSVCDNSILGKKFETPKLKLDLSSDFYNGKEKTEEEIKKLIGNAYMINLVGNNSVGLGLKIGVISKNDVIKIKNIPYVQAVSMKG